MFQHLQDKLHYYYQILFSSSGLKGRVARGSIWLGGGGGTEHILRLTRNMILTRIMAPEAFGSMAIILAVTAFFESFTQIGVRAAVIQNEKGNEDTFLNGVFWLAFVRGIVLFLFAIIIIPWIANFYNNPELEPMMQVAFLSILFNGIMSPKSYTELKKMNYKKWVFIFQGGSVIGITCAIVLGFILQNVWALVIGFTIENAARTFLSYVFCPFLPKFKFEKESIQSLFRFVRGVIGLPILVFIYNRVDIFVVGKLCTITELGMYSMAYALVRIPWMLYGSIFQPILFPMFSIQQHDHSSLLASVYRSSRYFAIFFLPLLTLLACSSSQLLSAVYGKPYAVVSLPFIILCASIAIRLIGSIIVIALIAIGKPQFTREASLIRAIIMCILIVPLVTKAGLAGAAVASLLSAFAWICTSFVRVQRTVGISVSKYINSLATGTIVSMIIIGVWWFI